MYKPFVKRRYLLSTIGPLFLRSCLTTSVEAATSTSFSIRTLATAFTGNPNCNTPGTIRAFASLATTSSIKSNGNESVQKMEETIQKLQDIIGADAGDRGMKSLIVPGDLLKASGIFGKLPVGSTVIVLSGFPCCVNESPPTETDGPPGAYAIARAAVAFGYKCIVATDDCNEAVFAAAFNGLALSKGDEGGSITLQAFPSTLNPEEQTRLDHLAAEADLIIACERAGPGADGNCYTMRAINMNEKGLIAPLHQLVEKAKVPFLAIGDGGNELGMGKVLEAIKSNPKINDGAKIGCTIAADHLIAASISNWGGYALAAGAALFRAEVDEGSVEEWINKCLPTEKEETELLDRCVAAGCRDGVSTKTEPTVDGMPLETSLQCLRDIRTAALAASKNKE